MASNEDIIREADYYLNNDVNIDQASSDLGISRRSFQLHMKKLASIAPDRFKLVTDKKENNIRQGNIKGGSLGKRTPKWTSEEAMSIASEMLDKSMTYEDGAKEFDIPKSTLHEMMHNGIKDEKTISLLYALAEANRRGLNLQEYMKLHDRQHVAVDEITREQIEQNISKKGKK